MTANAQTPAADTSGRLMIVANIYDTANPRETTVLFFESARIYKLCRSNRRYAKTLALLQDAFRRKKPVRVYTTVLHGTIIEKVD